MEQDQRQYQITFILSSDLDQKKIDDFNQEFEKIIVKQLEGKIIIKHSAPERKKLAYPIKKFEFGYYLTVSFLLDPQKTQELGDKLKYNKNILRYMINFVEESPEPKKKRFVQKPVIEKLEKKKKKKLEDIDKKLDEILGNN